jgi:hypothetical protein
MNDDEKRMMSEEYGKDFGGCVWAAVISAIVIVAAIVILFT